jgi:hypothetical protein
VNLLALGKEPWRFKDVDDQLNMYSQQWQAYQQKQIIANMAGNMPGKSNEGNIKIMKETIIVTMLATAMVAKAITAEEDAEEAKEVAAEDVAAILII